MRTPNCDAFTRIAPEALNYQRFVENPRAETLVQTVAIG